MARFPWEGGGLGWRHMSKGWLDFFGNEVDYAGEPQHRIPPHALQQTEGWEEGGGWSPWERESGKIDKSQERRIKHWYFFNLIFMWSDQLVQPLVLCFRAMAKGMKSVTFGSRKSEGVMKLFLSFILSFNNSPFLRGLKDDKPNFYGTRYT